MQTDFSRMGCLYAKRQKAYNQFMNKLNIFGVKAKKSQKELRENIKKEVNPFNDEAKKKKTMPQSLNCGDMSN